MSGTSIVLVTGANQGIGYYAAQQLAAKNYQVIIGCRDTKKGEQAIESIIADDSLKVDRANLETLQIDLADDASIEAAAEAVSKKYGRLDIVSNFIDPLWSTE